MDKYFIEEILFKEGGGVFLALAAFLCSAGQSNLHNYGRGPMVNICMKLFWVKMIILFSDLVAILFSGAELFVQFW